MKAGQVPKGGIHLKKTVPEGIVFADGTQIQAGLIQTPQDGASR